MRLLRPALKRRITKLVQFDYNDQYIGECVSIFKILEGTTAKHLADVRAKRREAGIVFLQGKGDRRRDRNATDRRITDSATIDKGSDLRLSA